ncbi:MAG: TonB-dependent receptor [Rhizomicrobium sp.]|jgi:iron complex outermembrane receptor protein
MSERSHRHFREILFSSTLCAALAAMVVPVQAQTVAANGPAAAPVEEVTVTAERRTTDLQRTSLAITAINGDTLQKSNVTQLSDINGLVPSLQVTSSAGFETVVTLRGVGLETPENSLTTSPGVALYMDGAYVANSITLDQTLFDIDHVEVLRGPQGALYGESATGGAILLVTKQASLDGFGGDVSASYGTYNLHSEEFDLNVPLTDTLAVHVAAEQFSHDGFDKDPLIPGYDPSNANDLIGKIDILWKPASNLTFTLSSESYHAYQNAAAQKNIDDPDPNPWEVTQDYPAKFNMATNLTHLNAQWDTSWFTVKSVTTYQWLANVQGEDSSRSAVALIGAYDDVAAWDTSLVNYNEELDFQSNSDGPFTWDAGLFLLSQRSNQFVAEFEGFSPPTPTDLEITLPNIQNNPNLAYGNVSQVDRKSWAVFVQATYQFTNQLSATLGGRENADTYTDISTNYSGANWGGPSANTVPHSSSDHVPTFTAVLNYYPEPDNLLYVSANRGYKPGGVNGDYGQYLVPDSFKPEVNTAFEIGSKNTFLDDHLTADFAGFYYIYQDMQYIETDPVPFDGGMSNIPSTHIWGGEAEAKYLGMDDHLHLDGTLSLENGAIQGDYFTIDSTIQQEIYATNPYCTEFGGGGKYFDSRCWAAVAAAAKNIGGNPPAKMPTALASFDVSYDFNIGYGLLTPGVQYIYRGGFWARDFDEPSLDKVPGYSLVNLSLDFVPVNSAFKISLVASNVGNVAGVDSQYTDPYGTFTTSRQYIPPRQVVLNVAYKF